MRGQKRQKKLWQFRWKTRRDGWRNVCDAGHRNVTANESAFRAKDVSFLREAGQRLRAVQTMRRRVVHYERSRHKAPYIHDILHIGGADDDTGIVKTRSRIDDAERSLVPMVAAQCTLQFREVFRASKRIAQAQFGRVWQDLEHESESTQAYRTDTVKHDSLVLYFALRFA